MFSNLTEKLNSALHVLKGHGKITEINIAETLKEVRRALLDADVSFKIAKDFTNNVKQKALGQNVLTDLHPGQLMVKIVKDELTELMGGDQQGINLSSKPFLDNWFSNSFASLSDEEIFGKIGLDELGLKEHLNGRLKLFSKASGKSLKSSIMSSDDL